MIICDSSSLILLTKSGLIAPLTKNANLIIPKQVYSEVVEEGLKKNFTDAVKVKELTDSKKIIVKTVKTNRDFSLTLGKGEKEALELFYQEKAEKVIVDDKKALNVCRLLKIPYTTVHIILVDLLERKMIDKKQAIESLDALNKEGRYSSEITLHYYDIINKVR